MRYRIRATGGTKPDLDYQANAINPALAYEYPLILIDELDDRKQATSPVKRKRRMGLSQVHQEIALAQRRLLRRAFDRIRYDPKRQALATELARALGASSPVTGRLLDKAREIAGQKP